MKRNALLSAAVLFLLLVTAGLFAQQPDRKLTPTSYGTAPHGYKAVADLLEESGLRIERNLAPFNRLPDGATVWWIEPTSLCGGAEAGHEGASPWSGAEWVERGGTAVIFLPAGSGPPACANVAGLALPERLEIGKVEEANPAPEAAEQLAKVYAPSDGPPRQVRGARVPTPRTLTTTTVGAFADTKEWTAAAEVEGKPFVLERARGRGRIVVVGDTRFLDNIWLARADAAPLALDLVRAYGPPIIDERDHGFGATGGGLAYLWRSPARGALLGLLVLGVVFAWWGAAQPPRTADSPGLPAPTLDSYVHSLATLYARARDHAAVAAQYRLFALGQLRRQTGLAPDVPADLVVERLLRQRVLDPAEARLLREPPPVASAAELRQQTLLLDEILRKAAT